MKNIQTARLITLSLIASATGVLAPAALAQSGNPPATHSFASSKPIFGRYIVVFKANVGNPAAETDNAMRGIGGQLHHV